MILANERIVFFGVANESCEPNIIFPNLKFTNFLFSLVKPKIRTSLGWTEESTLQTQLCLLSRKNFSFFVAVHSQKKKRKKKTLVRITAKKSYSIWGKTKGKRRCIFLSCSKLSKLTRLMRANLGQTL